MSKKIKHVEPIILESKKYRKIDYKIVLDNFGYSVIAFKSICMEVCGTFKTHEEALELFNGIGKKIRRLNE